MIDIDIMRNKEEIISLWQKTERPEVDRLINWLEDTDFFTAPCSSQFHLAVEGGLAQHSINVMNLLEKKIGIYGLADQIGPESVIVCGLGHDLCKVNFYVRGTRNVKENGIWREKQVWTVEDQFPFGHGEKSVSILQNFISLQDEEKLAIRWHMVSFDPGIHFQYPSGFPFQKASKLPLATLLFTADYEATNILEVGQ